MHQIHTFIARVAAEIEGTSYEEKKQNETNQGEINNSNVGGGEA